MNKGTLLVVGAAGDVGQGIVEAALAAGRKVVAAGRDEAKLRALADRLGSAALAWTAGDLANEAGAAALWRQAAEAFGGVEHVVVSVSASARPSPLLDRTTGDLAGVLSADLLTHFTAARSFLPQMPGTGLFIGIGGGTADFIFPGLAHVSMAQAAQRMLYRGLAKERKAGAQVRELMIVAMVAGRSDRDAAPPDGVTDLDVGRHVCAILDAPERFARPILHLRSREQVGQPEE